MTDSGTFQAYIYGKVTVDPLEIIEFQRDIGTDIGTILDIFSTPDHTLDEAQDAVYETIKRAKNSVPKKNDMLIACTIQGSIYPKLRTFCARELSKLETDVFPIGGVVPLMEKQQYGSLVDIIIAAKQGLDQSKPVHLFGAGHPLIFPLAVALGCDLFDSSSYAKYAQAERMLFPWGTEHLTDLNELPCACPVCSSYTATDLKNEEKSIQLKALATHNLYICYTELRRIKNAIYNGTLWKLVEERASINPHLHDALMHLKKLNNIKWLEKQESISKTKGLIYAGPYTMHQPLIYRIHNRILNHYIPPSTHAFLFPTTTTPYSSHYRNEIYSIIETNPEATFLVKSPYGPIPLELDEMYPFAQSEFPKNIDHETKKTVNKYQRKFLKQFHITNLPEYLKKIPTEQVPILQNIWDQRRMKIVADIQFGPDAGKTLLKPPLLFKKSKKTGKIRQIISQEKHILSMRAHDGYFTLKIDGGKRLHKGFKTPELRIIVNDEAAEYIKQGKSVFSKFVQNSDPSLRPYDECLIVDNTDTLLAIGRCILTPDEMKKFNHGVAVKTRESIQS
jgi:7-cyano-7-deazaguanine tRNA-ribosyltransferase